MAALFTFCEPFLPLVTECSSCLIFDGMSADQTWVQPVLWASTAVFFLAGSLVSILWIRRERRIRLGLGKIIDAEKTDDSSPASYRAAKDVEEALRNLFESRSAELARMKMMENYRRDYVGNVSHELKTPLFSIQGYLETVLDDPELDAETRQLFLTKALKNVNRLGQIIRDLDAITKFESGVLKPEIQDFDALVLVHDVVESLELQAQAKSVNLVVNAPEPSYWVQADPSLIRQVVTNLAINSIKYSKPEGQTKIKLSSTGSRVIVEVADNGIGIKSEHQSRIFERFYRVNSDRSRDTGGSGLGLSICKHIVEAHGEQIQVISTEGAGSTFSFGLKAKGKPN